MKTILLILIILILLILLIKYIRKPYKTYERECVTICLEDVKNLPEDMRKIYHELDIIQTKITTHRKEYNKTEYRYEYNLYRKNEDYEIS